MLIACRDQRHQDDYVLGTFSNWPVLDHVPAAHDPLAYAAATPARSMPMTFSLRLSALNANVLVSSIV
jgi:hypothetical protein